MPSHRPFPPAPLPGAGRPVRGLFVSRSGILLADGAARADALAGEVSAAALRVLFRAGQRGWSLYLIGNEASVARGKVSDAAWDRFEGALIARLRAEGIPIRRHYACVDHPRGKGAHRRDSVFRFPNTGALYHAAQEDGIELRESWVISHDVDELAAGWRAGCRTARAGASRASEDELAVEADLVSPDVAAALAEVLATDEYTRT